MAVALEVEATLDEEVTATMTVERATSRGPATLTSIKGRGEDLTVSTSISTKGIGASGARAGASSGA